MTISNLPVKDAQDLQMILSALQREKSILEWEIKKTRDNLNESEQEYKLTSEVFYQKYRSGEMGDDEMIMVWAGEYQFFLRYKKKHSRLEGLITECQRLIDT